MDSTLMSIVSLIFLGLGIGFAIGLHELGHLIPAKLFGVKVPKYAIGFGPTLLRRQIGETEYAIKLIPLGGFITMIGMYPPDRKPTKRRRFANMIATARSAHSEHIGPNDGNRQFYQLPVYKRVIIMFGGPLMNLILGFTLIFGALGTIGEPTRSTTISEVAACVPVVASDCNPETDGPSPAASAGLRPGDEIVAVNGISVEKFDQVSSALKIDQVSVLTVIRSQQELEVPVTPVAASRPQQLPDGSYLLDANGQPVLAPAPVIGIVLKEVMQPLAPAQAFARANDALGQTVTMLLSLPQQVAEVVISTVSGTERNTNGLVSIVGVGQIAVEVGVNPGFDLLQKLSVGLLILGSLNMALFAFNMIPLLPLDGGHIAGGIYEALKRVAYRFAKQPDPGPADTALLMPLTYLVFLGLIFMSVVLIVADIVNPIIA